MNKNCRKGKDGATFKTQQNVNDDSRENQDYVVAGNVEIFSTHERVRKLQKLAILKQGMEDRIDHATNAISKYHT